MKSDVHNSFTNITFYVRYTVRTALITLAILKLLQSNTESIRLLNAALVNGYSIVTYQRPLRAHDELDLPIFTNGSQAVIWAIGPLNSLQEVSYHSIKSKSKFNGFAKVLGHISLRGR